jgi:hypothetical protein
VWGRAHSPVPPSAARRNHHGSVVLAEPEHSQAGTPWRSRTIPPLFVAQALFSPSNRATIILLSRFSHLVLPSPVDHLDAAMPVQPNALALKAIQYIVLYCLTPPQFHRYSSCNLCPPSPAQDGIEPSACFDEEAGIRLVNRPSGSETYWPLTTGSCFSQGVHVA